MTLNCFTYVLNYYNEFIYLINLLDAKLNIVKY